MEHSKKGETELFRYQMIGTGLLIENDNLEEFNKSQYIGTVKDGIYIWHIFSSSKDNL